MMLPRTLLVLALAASSLAWGEPLESPERIARLGYVEGQVAFRAAQEVATSDLPDRPLIPGDRLVTDGGGRAELTFGIATLRLDERTELSIVTLDATTARVELTRGTASVHLRELYDDETFVVATPNTTLTLREPGEYRIAVPAESTTDLTVRGGSAEALTAGGPVRIADGQRVRLEGRQALASLATPRAADAFDDFVLERELQLADVAPSTEQLATGYEYEELDRYGEWHDEPSYGRVWMPSYAYGGYDPFRYGYWQSYGMGRTWINSMPWGYDTF
ncbi:MAG: FecR domain-containing protein, partial [Pseudomonadota bacterium]|nr:FecR domain-containing protein [Pseudomonadota bacterium]